MPGSPRRGWDLAEHRGVGALELEKLNIVESLVLEHFLDGIGGATHLRGIELGGTDGRNSYQRFEIAL